MLLCVRKYIYVRAYATYRILQFAHSAHKARVQFKQSGKVKDEKYQRL